MAKPEILQKGPKDAKQHTLATTAPFDTLESIAKKNAIKDGWKTLALYLFGSEEADAVNRALVESVGVAKVNLAHAEKTELKPMQGHSGKLALPEEWTAKDFEAGKRYRLSIAKAKAPTAIAITNLDKWFIPGVETCDLSYTLEGDPSAADKIDFLVYGCNYCESTEWNDGWGKFTVVENEPLFKEEKIKAPERGNHLLEVAGKDGKTAWKGQTTTEKGVLAKKKDGDTERFVNVAFSPYTVLMRYYKVEADAKARIELPPFWPIFKTDGTPKNASTDIKWKLAESGNKLKQGSLIIWDKFDSVVFSKALAEGDLKDGEHTFSWDWKYSSGSKTAKADQMPFRVQIQAHTPVNTPEGLALAAMHTEVRMYVHPKTHAPDLDPYVAKTNKSSLAFGLADVWHKDKELKKADDGKIWTKYQLAKAGFHPGPVTDATVTDEFKLALHEFQKSAPKKRPGGAGDYERLTVSDNDDADTRDALEVFEEKRTRPWFGIAKDRKDYANTSDLLLNDLRNPEEEVVVWVDDRYWYADAGWVSEDGTTIRADVRDHASALTEPRNGYAIGDARVDLDKRDIARPWLPFEVRVVLLSKTDDMSAEKDIASVTKAQWKASAVAVGPLRVDWTFDEIDGDTIEVKIIDKGMYHTERTRTKKAVEWVLNDQKATHTRKDVKLSAKYYNCLETYGGVRPTTSADYFKSVFGVDAQSLFPCKAKPDETRESIVTVAHADLGEKQKDEEKFTKRMGRSGVYFHPSNMAGDGYQVRAEVRFEESDDYKFPNAKVLGERYPQMPQAHSAKMRLWRKASLRGYVCWGPNDNFGGSVANFRKIYEGSNMHFVNENNEPDGNIKFTGNTLFPAVADYRSMVKELVNPAIAAPGNIRRQDANITITGNRLWPWHGHDQFGVVEGSASFPDTGNWGNDWGTGWGHAQTLYNDHAAPYYYRLAVRLSSEIARVLEAKHGYMRGNVILEMQSSDQVDLRLYQCTTCSDYQSFIEKHGVPATHEGASCSDPLCGGTLTDAAVAKWRDNLPVPSLGNPIGVAINFAGGYELWAHEIGHTRYMEHAGNAPASRGGAGAAAARDLVHDSVANPAMAGDAVAEARRWDRACLMTYASHLASYDAGKDKTYPCYKCVLKNRGWKIETLPNSPPGNIVDA